MKLHIYISSLQLFLSLEYVSSFKLYAFDPQSAPYRYMLKYGIGNVQHNVVVLQLGMGMFKIHDIWIRTNMKKKSATKSKDELSNKEEIVELNHGQTSTFQKTKSKDELSDEVKIVEVDHGQISTTSTTGQKKCENQNNLATSNCMKTCNSSLESSYQDTLNGVLTCSDYDSKCSSKGSSKGVSQEGSGNNSKEGSESNYKEGLIDGLQAKLSLNGDNKKSKVSEYGKKSAFVLYMSLLHIGGFVSSPKYAEFLHYASTAKLRMYCTMSIKMCD
ncbi:hypothetical protein GLOIN_2v1769560 [Rhizophagus irregularis DAOM 181602=DAOM 197198]|nr:hypothetical protein GLOIN_2v1769560 [Rhizophagus irregularis DAOM 181602=DAOM 197198]